MDTYCTKHRITQTSICSANSAVTNTSVTKLINITNMTGFDTDISI